LEWEYLIVVTRNLDIGGGASSFGVENHDREETVGELNEYGAEEWELISLQPAGAEWLATLKRAK
jgi:hypothetical protein